MLNSPLITMQSFSAKISEVISYFLPAAVDCCAQPAVSQCICPWILLQAYLHHIFLHLVYLKSLNTNKMNITHSFRFKNTHKNITVRCHAQAVSKHFPFTFFAAQQSSSPLNTVGKITSALRNQDQIFILCPARLALEMSVCFCGCGSLMWVCVVLSVYSWLSLRPRFSGSSWLSAEMLLLSQSVHTTLVPIAVGCSCHPRPCGPHIPLCVCFCLGILFYMRPKHFNGFGITVCCNMSKISTSVGLSMSLL